MHDKLLAGQEQVSLKPMHTIKEQNVALTFDLVTWFSVATRCLVMINICAKLFLNATMRNEVVGRIRTGFTEVCAQS